MDTKLRGLFDRMRVGPTFLLIGQSFWSTDGVDHVLQKAFQAADVSASPDLQTLIELSAQQKSRVYDRMASTSLKAELGSKASFVADFRWNGVYTSSIDARAARTFESDSRRVSSIVGSDLEVKNPRSQSDLKLWMLFGGVTLAEDQRPPIDSLDLALRNQQAASSLSNLATNLLTPRGVVVIEGYSVDDWLAPDRLFAFLSQLLPGQAHMFSVDEFLERDPFIQGAVERGMLTLHKGSLSAAIDVGESAGRLSPSNESVDTGARLVRLSNGLVELPRDVWNSVISSARPVDESLLTPLPSMSEALKYQRFRTFLGGTEGAIDWEAIAAGFNFHREFEQTLWDRIAADIQSSQPPEPIILEGQTASGKSTALASIALRAVQHGNVAALYVAKRGSRPLVDPIDRYVRWVEDNGTPITLLLWDGMGDPDDYFSAHRELRARGRRVHIVGTTYLFADRQKRGVHAGGRLSEGEARNLRPWLESFGIGVADADH